MQKIALTTNRGMHAREVHGYVYGAWAAHGSLTQDCWTVSHVESGLTAGPLVAYLTMDQARRVAHALGAMVPDLVVLGDVDSISRNEHTYLGRTPQETKQLVESVIAEALA